MNSLPKEQKNRAIAGGVTTVVCALVLLVLCFITLKTVTPPPPPKKTIMIELTAEAGGGGGGGQPNVASTSHKAKSSAKPIATQNAEKSPAVSTGKGEEAVSKEPKVDNKAMYGHRGTGSGGGSGSGSGTGTGKGFGPGEGGGSGGGIGYGTNRSMMNKLNLSISEQGVVVVEVHISAEGSVMDAKVLSQYGKYKTTITNAKIRQECIAIAKTARYAKGKEELGIIIFQ